jgi:outer membrane protein assembly factor BamB
MVLPAAAGSTVYVVDNNGNLAALRARDGRRLWGTSLGGGVAQGPVATGGAVYLAGNDGSLYAVNASTGARAWRTSISGGAMTVPVVAGHAVYVVVGNRLDAVRA